MNINRKIEEIRQKPEHIRIRYVWAGVVITMFFIIILWIFSMKESISNNMGSGGGYFEGIRNSIEESQGQEEGQLNDWIQSTNEGFKKELEQQDEVLNSEEAPL